MLLDRMSMTQRAGIFASLAGMMLVVFLHFPFAGYTYQELVVVEYAMEKCPPPVDPRKDGLAAVIAEIEVLKRCTDKKEWQYLPFSEWSSQSPIFPLFRMASTTLIALVSIAVLGLAWVRIFSTSAESKSPE